MDSIRLPNWSERGDTSLGKFFLTPLLFAVVWLAATVFAGSDSLVRAEMPGFISPSEPISSTPVTSTPISSTPVTSTPVTSAGNDVRNGPTDARWRDSLAEGWRDSKATGLPMVIFISSENCIYCDAMEKNTWCSDEVRRELGGRFIPVHLIAGRNAESLAKVDVKVYPTTVIATPAGKVVQYEQGFQPPGRIRQVLSKLPGLPIVGHRKR